MGAESRRHSGQSGGISGDRAGRERDCGERYYQPRIDQVPDNQDRYNRPEIGKGQTALAGRAKNFNRRLESREFTKKYVFHPAGRILEAPSRYLGQALSREKDEDAAETGRVLAHTRTAGILLGNRADRERMKKVLRDAGSLDRRLEAGRLFEKDSFTQAGSIFQEAGRYSIPDPEKVTRGDLKAFRYQTDHPGASVEELLEIRRVTNDRYSSGGRIGYERLGHRNRLRRQVDRLVDVAEIRAFMDFGRKLGEERPDLFTPAQKSLLYRRGSILRAGSPAELEATGALVRQILKAVPRDGDLSRLDREGRMSPKDIGRLLESRIPGVKLVKAGKTERMAGIPQGKNGGGILLEPEEYHLFRGGLKALRWNQGAYIKAERLRQKLAVRGGLGRLAAGSLERGMEEDETFAALAAWGNHAVPLAVSSVRAGAGGAEATARAAGKAGGAAGKAVTAGLEASGNQVAAEAVRALGEGIAGTGRAVRDGADQVIHGPGRLARKGGEQVLAAAGAGARKLGRSAGRLGQRAAATKAGRAVVRNPVSRTVKGAGRTLVHSVRMGNRAARALLRFSGSLADGVRQGIVRPAALVLGAVLVLQLVIAAASGGAGGSLAVTVAVFDTPEHFNNPGYTVPEEMGFQQQYEQSQARFQAQIEGIIHGLAKTLDRKGRRIPYGVSHGAEQEGAVESDYANGVTLHFDGENSDNLEDIISCLAVVMMQKLADHHKEALELADCFYRSSHTYDYIESPLYDCGPGCETTRYFCNEAGEGYPGTDMRFAPYLHEELVIPGENQACEVDRENPAMAWSGYAGCTVTGTCYHNSGDEGDNFGRRKPSHSTCSRPEACHDCKHSCDRETCSHDCSGSATGCGGYWYCGGHDHFGCPEGHDARTCSGHVNVEMHIHMKSMEELFVLGDAWDGDGSFQPPSGNSGDPGDGEPAVGTGFGIENIHGEEIWMGWTIFESGNVGYAQAGGDGGRAYGRYQFDYRYALPDFLKYAVARAPDTCSMLAKYTGLGAGDQGLLSSTGLGDDWVRAWNADREGFSRLQDEFAYSRYYLPARNAMAERGIDLDAAGDPVVKGTVYSLAVRDGATDSGVRAAWQSYAPEDDIRSWLDRMYGLEAQRHPGQAERWSRGQKAAALNGATTGYLGDLGSVLSADGTVYRDFVGEWISRYPELSGAFRESGGWSRDNRQWAMALRGAGDWQELYGIRGGSLDFSSATSGGISLGDPEECAESLVIPDNGGSMPVVYMAQGGGQPWSSLPFGGGTVASSGCSVTSLAMVLSYLRSGADSGGWVYPSDIIASIAGRYGTYNYFYTAGGQRWDIFPAVASLYGVTCRQISPAVIGKELAAGHPVVMSCRPGEFTSAGHFIVLTGLTDDGYVVVNDPNPAHASYSYKKYTAAYLAGCGKGWWSFSGEGNSNGY